MANPTQAELEPGFESEHDLSAIVDAGVRSEPMVTSIQDEVTGVMASSARREDPTLQAAVEQSGLSPLEQVLYRRGTGNDNTDRYAGGVLGAVESIKTGRDIYDSIDENVTTVADSVDANAHIVNAVLKDTEEVLKNDLRVAAQASEGDVKKLMAVYNEISTWDAHIRGNAGFEAYTEQQLNAISAIKSADGNRVVEEDFYRRYGDSIVAKAWDATSTGRAWYDGIKAGIGISGTVAMADFTEKFEPGNFASVVNALGETVGRVANFSITGKGFDAYKQTLEAFWQLPINQRVVALTPIEEHIREISFNKEAGASNVFVYMSMMMPFVDKSESKTADLDYLMDSLTVLGWAPVKTVGKVFKFAKSAAQSRKPIKILQSTGNTEKAARLINKALADNADRARRVTGMSQAEVAYSANPMDLSRAVPEQIQGVAAEAQKQLEKEILDKVGLVDQAYIRTTDPSLTPVRYYYDEAAKSARQREIMGPLNDEVNTARIVESTETGFTVEVDRAFTVNNFYDRQTREAAKLIAEENLKNAASELQFLVRGANLDKGLVANVEKLIGGTLDEDTFSELRFLVGKGDKDINAAIDYAATYYAQTKMNERILKDLARPSETQRIKVNYTFDQAGRQDAALLKDLTMPHVASPSQVTDQLVKGASDEATLAEFTSTQILHNLHSSVRDVLRGLTGGQIKSIDALLVHGDEMGRVFDVQELIGSGVQTKYGLVKLDSTKSVAAYYAKRTAFDHIHRIENYLKRRGLENAGFKELHSNLKMADGSLAKMYAKKEGKTMPANVKRIYDHRTGSIVDVAELENLAGRLDGEWVVTRFRSGIRSGDEVINYGLIREGELRPIGGQVLNYRPGYVPKMRQGVFYVASKNMKRMVDGNMTDARETARFFRTREEAEKWRLSQKDATKYDIIPDKQYTSPTHNSFDEEFDDINFGGLYFGERTSRDILMGLDGTEARRVSAYKALNMNMNHIANRYSSNELKMGLIGRFQNTYKDYLENPTNWEGPLTSAARNDTKLAESIEAQRKFIKDLMRQTTMSEDWWNNKMRAIAEAITAKEPLSKRNINAATSDFFMNLSAKDPISVIRATTFHQYLGMFNPAQILVQGMGFATAFAAYPGKAMKMLPMNIALMAAWQGRKNEKAISMIAGHAQTDARYLSDVVNEIKRVGLFDSLKSTADYNAGAEGISLSGDAMRRMSDAGLMFMRGGEQWARGYGYLLARDLFLSKKKKGYKLTNKDIDEVAKDSMRFTLNLNRSNRAWWQKGVLSIPTQFYQVMTKFLENMVGGSLGYGVRKWTPGEKAKIMTGYLAMFGASGVPFMDSFVSDAMNAKKQATDDPKAMSMDKINPFNNMPPELQVSDDVFARFIRGGLVQVMASWTGSDPEISTRFSIPAGIEETYDLFKTGQRGLLDGLGGAAAPGLMRWFDAAKGLYDIFGPGKTLDIGDDEMRQGVMEVANIFSSTRNAVSKAAWYNEIGKITNKKGQKLFPELETDQFSSMMVWQALGFQPANIGWMYDLDAGTKELEGRVGTALEETARIMAKYAPDETYLDTVHKTDNINFRINTLTAGFTVYEQEEFAEGLKNISEMVYGDKDKLTEIILKAQDRIAKAGGLTTPGAAANPLLVPKGQ